MPALLEKERDLLSPTTSFSGFSCYPKHSWNYRTETVWADIEEIDDHIHLWSKKSDAVKIVVSENYSIEVKSVFAEFIAKVVESRYIVDLKDNWDDNHSRGYSDKTFYNAVNFFNKYANWILAERGTVIEPPDILPSNDGSIDLFWNKKSYDLLINIPSSPSELVKFYGDNKKESKIEGSFILDSFNQGIFLSLLQE